MRTEMERIDSKWDFQTKGKNNFRLERDLKKFLPNPKKSISLMRASNQIPTDRIPEYLQGFNP